MRSMLNARDDADHGHRDHACPDAAIDVVEVVRGVDEHAAHGRADEARLMSRRVGRAQLGRPLGRDRAAGVADQPDLRGRRDAGRGEASAARSESSVLMPYSGPAAKSAVWPSVSGDHDGCPASSAGTNSADSTLRDRAAERQRRRRSCTTARRRGSASRRRTGRRRRWRRPSGSGGSRTEVTLTVGWPSWPVER